MSARDEILRRVRDALGPAPAVPEIVRGYRISGEEEGETLVARFTERAGEYQATVRRCAPPELPGVIASVLHERGSREVLAPTGLPDAWTAGLGLGHADDAASALDLDAVHGVVTTCTLAIAETGTIVLDGGPGQGRRALTLVPDHHVCVVPADRIVAGVPEAMAALDPGRATTLISGPSATSDIELDRVEGVHGPRRLDIVVLADAAVDPPTGSETHPGPPA